ncbi:MAG: hypothetical protein V4451_04860 [Pseudomonadota bacterium]
MGVHEMRSDAAACVDGGAPGTGTVQGVGARQGDLFASEGGGGYLNERTPSKNWEMAKLAELAEMGLPGVWLEVAREIGYDNFLKFWKIMDAAAERREVRRSENESMIEVQLRRFKSFKRYQRNRLIETLAAAGLTAAAIAQSVKQQLGEKLHNSHIRRVARRGRIKG